VPHLLVRCGFMARGWCRRAFVGVVVMAEDWQVGDLALCVEDHRNFLGCPEVRPGGVYTVDDLFCEDWTGQSGLVLKDRPSSHYSKAHAACRFRKIRPLSDEERDSFLADLDEPVRTRQPAMTILEKGRSL
jgi:hypothetical protein